MTEIKSRAAKVLATSDDPEARSMAAYVLSDADDARVSNRKASPSVNPTEGDSTMTKAPKEDDVPLELAKTIVEKDEEARKDGVATDRADEESGIAMKAQAPDKSVLTYDPKKVEYAKEPKPEKSPYKSGEPVHDVS